MKILRSPLLIFSCINIILCVVAIGGEPDPVTVAVRNTLRSLYPEGEVLKIDKERKAGVRRFEATIKDKAGEHTVILRSDGSVVESRNQIAPETLPKVISDVLIKFLPGAKTTSVFKIQKGSRTTYRIITDSSKAFTFNENGSEALEPKE